MDTVDLSCTIMLLFLFFRNFYKNFYFTFCKTKRLLNKISKFSQIAVALDSDGKRRKWQ